MQDSSRPDRRIVYVLLFIGGMCLAGWIAAVIVGRVVPESLGTLLAATVGGSVGAATTWLSRRGTPADVAPTATVAVPHSSTDAGLGLPVVQ